MVETTGGENEFDLFVSYAHADDQDGWVAALVERIREEHAHLTLRRLGVFFDRDAIQTMDDWEHRILAGLKASKVMLAVLSPAYFQSEFCRREWEVFLDHELARTVPGEGIAPIYVVTAPGLEDGQATLDKWIADLQKRQYLDLRPWWPEGKAALELEEVRLKLQALEEQVAKRLDAAETVEASPSTVPEHNRNFVGRTKELSDLRNMLIAGRVGAITAVHGVGGIGKSALAFEYGHAFAAEYPGGRFMVSVAEATDLRIPIVNLAPKLGIELTDDEKKGLAAGFARVRARLEEGQPSLLLLDNLDEAALLAPAKRGECLPHGRNVHILVTTRVGPEQLPGLDCLALDRLSDEDGLKLLERYRPPEGDEEWKAALGIVHRLGGHALAVEVVAVYQAQNVDIRYAGFLARLEEEGLGALDAAGEDPLVELSRHPAKMLGPLLEPTLAALSPAETRVLEYACLLPPDCIAVPWLRELSRSDFPELVAGPKPGYPNPWQRLVRRLEGLRLLIRGDEEHLARMHRIVQDVVSVRMDPQRRDQHRGRLVSHAKRRVDFLNESRGQHDKEWEIAPVRDYADLLMEAGDPDGAFLGHQAALLFNGNLREARALMVRVIEIDEKAFGPEHLNLAASYSDLAMIERLLGVCPDEEGLPEARATMLRAIAIEEKALEPDDPQLATSYTKLALIEESLGNLPEARALMLRAIRIDEIAFKLDHPTLARGYSKLAMIERGLGNLPEARRLMLRSIEIDEKALEPDHPTLARGYSKLAMIELALGNLSEARAQVLRAIEIKEKHDMRTELAWDYSNLAVIEYGLGNPHEARERMHQAIYLDMEVLGSDPPQLANDYYRLAKIEQTLGDLAAAREFMRRAFPIWRARLGDGDPHTQASRQWLEKNDPEFDGGD